MLSKLSFHLVKRKLDSKYLIDLLSADTISFYFFNFSMLQLNDTQVIVFFHAMKNVTNITFIISHVNVVIAIKNIYMAVSLFYK